VKHESVFPFLKSDSRRRLRMAKETQKRAGKPTSLIAQIDELEKRITAMGPGEEMSFMDDDLDAVGIGDVELEVGDAAPVEVLDDGVVEEDFMDMDDEFMDMDDEFMDMDDGEEFCDGMMASEKEASESRPGIEDQITQDYLSEVVDLRHGEELDTDASMLDTARNGSEEAVVRLKSASARLDKVATYLEKNGRTKLALHIDKIADAIDARIEGGQE
jgi:hypothetical protein